jgi:hypothetical protein
MAHDVFISYASTDKPTADALCAFLEQQQVRCWIAPRDIPPGMDWGQGIIEAIEQCAVMVLVFSSKANQSQQIKREVERAVAKGVIVIPLRIEDVPPSKTLEYFISGSHWLDALTPPLEAHLKKLAETIAMFLERAGRAKSPSVVVEETVSESAASVDEIRRLPIGLIATGALVVIIGLVSLSNWLRAGAGTASAQEPALTPASSAPVASAGPETSGVVTADAMFRNAWTDLGRMHDVCKGEWAFNPYESRGDFFAGLRTFGCFAGSLISYQSLQAAAGMPIFLSGPHTASELSWESPNSFGHYNPAFVAWFVDHAVPAAADPAFRASTQPLYDRHVRALARVFLETYRKSQREAGCFRNEVDKYQGLVQAQNLPDGYYMRFLGFLSPEFCANPDVKVEGDWERECLVMTSTAFWIRRTLDGTADEFARGLIRLVSAYDARFMNQ